MNLAFSLLKKKKDELQKEVNDHQATVDYHNRQLKELQLKVQEKETHIKASETNRNLAQMDLDQINAAIAKLEKS